MGIIEERISLKFSDYHKEPEDGYGIFMVTKDVRIAQECQHVYYDFYLTPKPVFPPLPGFTKVGDYRLPMPLHINVLQALSLENAIDNVGTLDLLIKDNVFN